MNSLGADKTDLNPLFVRALTDAQFDLYAFICMVLGNREVARDVLQETNLMLMNHADDYDESRAFLPWAKAFAYNQARTYRKRKSRSPLVFDDDLVVAIAEETMEEPAESGRELELLETCMGKLTESQQNLIQARYFRGESVEHIAVSMNKSVMSVHVQLHRIRRLLGALIEEKMHAVGEGVRT